MDYAKQHCQPCEGGVAKASSKEVAEALNDLPNWRSAADIAIRAEWSFDNFSKAKSFVDQISELAEKENHHPDISFGWGYAKLLLTTHAIDGLSDNDFIMAAKINEIADAK